MVPVHDMDLTNLNKDRNRKKTSVEPMMFGKVPPQAKEIEEVVLGAIMLEKNAFDLVSDILTPEKFYVDAHQRIYRAMCELDKKNSQIDMLTVSQQLISTEEIELVGGAYYVSKLTNSVVSSAHIETHAMYIVHKWKLRELIRIGGEAVTLGYDDTSDPEEIKEVIEQSLTSLDTDKKDISHVRTAVVDSLHRISRLKQAGSDITGIPSGFKELDRITHGWQDTDLIILAARPSVGKTAFALNLARNAAVSLRESGKSIAFFSLEMSIGQLTQRLLSAESEIWLDKISTGRTEEHEDAKLYQKSDFIGSLPIYIDDTSTINISQLSSKCRRLKRKKNLGMVIIDYLQLMSGSDKNNNREQEISKISRYLKGLAKELSVPIIALSQLSRALETRSGKKTPQLSDLRESGAIEQDADMVMFLYRPEYHDITANEMGESTKGYTELSIAKHRNGKLALHGDVIKLKALLHIQKFVDYTEEGDHYTTYTPGGSFRPVSSQDVTEDAF